MPMTGRSFEMASSTSLTDFFRPTSMGMMDPGNSTEFRRGRTEMVSGTSIGPSGTGFLEAMFPIVYATVTLRQCRRRSVGEGQPPVGPAARLDLRRFRAAD